MTNKLRVVINILASISIIVYAYYKFLNNKPLPLFLAVFILFSFTAKSVSFLISLLSKK